MLHVRVEVCTWPGRESRLVSHSEGGCVDVSVCQLCGSSRRQWMELWRQPEPSRQHVSYCSSAACLGMSAAVRAACKTTVCASGDVRRGEGRWARPPLLRCASSGSAVRGPSA